MTWSELDRPIIPDYVSFEQRLEGCFQFHNQLGGNALQWPTGLEASVDWHPRFSISVCADGMRSPFNVGALLRLIDNFGFAKLILAQSTVKLDHPQCVKAARGCENWIPVERPSSLADWLKQFDGLVVGMETGANAIEIAKWRPPEKLAVVIGQEQYGISPEIQNLCHQLLKIPTFGNKASMNVSHALAVFGYHVTTLRR